MPAIRTVEEAANRAEEFLKRYHTFRTLKSVHKEGQSWKLLYDISILPLEDFIEITLDANTGDVISYGKGKQ